MRYEDDDHEDMCAAEVRIAARKFRTMFGDGQGDSGSPNHDVSAFARQWEHGFNTVVLLAAEKTFELRHSLWIKLIADKLDEASYRSCTMETYLIWAYKEPSDSWLEVRSCR